MSSAATKEIDNIAMGYLHNVIYAGGLVVTTSWGTNCEILNLSKVPYKVMTASPLA